MPPTAEATTGFFFQSASETVRPKPSRKLFCTTIVEARCSAFTSKGAQAGSSRILMSGSCSRSEEHTSELQSHVKLVCRLLLEKKNRAKEQAYLLMLARSCTTM